MTVKKAAKKKTSGKVNKDADKADTIDKAGNVNKDAYKADTIDKAGNVNKDADKADTIDAVGANCVRPPSSTKPGVLAGRELVDAVVSVLEEKLAEKISVIDLRKVSAAADWFVVCHGDNTSHVAAAANEVIGALKERHGTAPWRHEGIEDGRWALIDYTDVVVHVMLQEVREYYNLEGLWG